MNTEAQQLQSTASTDESLAPMRHIYRRLNLIFHGLIAFVEKGHEYHVLFPDSDMHDFLAGDPESDPEHPREALFELPKGCFHLFGVTGAAAPSCQPALRHSIVLRGTSV